MSKRSDLLDVIRSLGESDGDKPSLISQEEQRKILTKFLAMPATFKVGDFVQRNEFGKKRYMWPEKEQLALVTSVLAKPLLDEAGSIVHGEITVIHGDRVFGYAVDFRYYEKTDDSLFN